MEKKVLLKKLVEEGRHIRREFIPTAVVSDYGTRPIGEFWDANKTIDVIVNGAHEVHDTIRETDEYIHAEETRAKQAEKTLQDNIDAETARATGVEATKADKSTTYTKSEVDALIAALVLRIEALEAVVLPNNAEE
jgi:hypothetical protein